MSSSLLNLSTEPIKFEPVTKATPVFYDETNKEIFAVTSIRDVSIYSLQKGNSCPASVKIESASSIISVKFSLDHKILAIQREPQSIDFLNISDDTEFKQSCRNRSGTIIGFNWTCQNEIVFITHQGIEFYQVSGGQAKVKHLKSYNVSVNWFVFSPQFCILVVSSTMAGNILHPFHFKLPQHGNSTVQKLPKFEVELAQSSGNNKAQLLEREVSILTIHGKLFLAIMKNPRSSGESMRSAEILLYTLLADSPACKVASLQLGITGRFAINVVDNLIAVHHQGSRTSMLFDICWTPANEPTNTLALNTTPGPKIKIPTFCTKEGSCVTFRPILQPMSIAPFKYEDSNCELYSSSWVVFQPGIVIDAKLGLLWELKLNVSKLALHMVCSKQSLVKLLLHRKHCKSTILSTLRSFILTQSSHLNTTGDIFDIINSVPYTSEEVHITQDEIRSEVITPLLTKEDVPTQYCISIVTEYIRSIRLHKATVSYYYYEILIQLLTRSSKLYTLHQLIQFNVVGDSLPLAYLLLSLTKVYTPAFLLGLDMLKRLNAHDDIIDALLEKQDITAAIKYTISVNMESFVGSRKFLEAATKSGDNALFFSTYEFFEARNEKVNKGCEEVAEEYRALYESLFITVA